MKLLAKLEYFNNLLKKQCQKKTKEPKYISLTIFILSFLLTQYLYKI